MEIVWILLGGVVTLLLTWFMQRTVTVTQELAVEDLREHDVSMPERGKSSEITVINILETGSAYLIEGSDSYGARHINAFSLHAKLLIRRDMTRLDKLTRRNGKRRLANRVKEEWTLPDQEDLLPGEAVLFGKDIGDKVTLWVVDRYGPAAPLTAMYPQNLLKMAQDNDLVIRDFFVSRTEQALIAVAIDQKTKRLNLLVSRRSLDATAGGLPETKLTIKGRLGTF